MENISRFYKEKYLLIEGFNDFSYVNNTGYLFSVLFLILSEFDVKLIFSKDEIQTVAFINKLYLKKHYGYSKAVEHDRIYFASKFFGLSEKKLEIILSME